MPHRRAAGRPPQWLLFTITIIGITLITPIAPVIPDILRAFEASETAAGLILGSATAPGILLAPVIGVLADRHGRRRVLVPCLVVFAAAGTISAYVPTLTWLAVARFLQGMGAAGLINLVVVLIGDHWDGLDRVRVIGRNSAALTAGLASIPTVGGFMADAFGWRGPFYLYPIGFVVAFLAWRYLPKDRPTASLSVREQLRASWAVLKTPVVAGLVFLMIGMMIAVFGLILTVLPFHLEEEFGLSAGGRGVFLGLPSLVSFWVALNAGRIARRFGRGRAVTAGIFVFGLSFAVLGSPLPLAVYALGAILWGLAEGLVFPPTQDRVVEAADHQSRGTVMAVWVGGLRLGQSIGPLLGGLGLVTIGSAASFQVGAVVVLLMALAAFLGRRRLAMQ